MGKFQGPMRPDRAAGMLVWVDQRGKNRRAFQGRVQCHPQLPKQGQIGPKACRDHQFIHFSLSAIGGKHLQRSGSRDRAEMEAAFHPDATQIHQSCKVSSKSAPGYQLVGLTPAQGARNRPRAAEPDDLRFRKVRQCDQCSNGGMSATKNRHPLA
ncbi:MAG: hypothetical protein Q27BPR15_16445 [Rhodobacter sp. CACIA14H1]|nr:MAG: hypothetical protein Q27BPR15_16445 [Rhodobacter sp. CACIA14H1]